MSSNTLQLFENQNCELCYINEDYNLYEYTCLVCGSSGSIDIDDFNENPGIELCDCLPDESYDSLEGLLIPKDDSYLQPLIESDSDDEPEQVLEQVSETILEPVLEPQPIKASFGFESAKQFLEMHNYTNYSVNGNKCSMVCGKCNSNVGVSIASVKNAYYNNLKPSFCKTCKKNKKDESFSLRCGFDKTTIGDFNVIKCRSCQLSYVFEGCDVQYNFSCYCKMTSKRNDHDLYKKITRECNDLFFLNKEVKISGNHKCDIYLKNKTSNKELFIEVDEDNHFSKSSKSYKRDCKIYEEVSDKIVIHIETGTDLNIALDAIKLVNENYNQGFFFITNSNGSKYRDLYTINDITNDNFKYYNNDTKSFE